MKNVDSNKLNPKKIKRAEDIAVIGTLGIIVGLGQLISFKLLDIDVMDATGERIMAGGIVINFLLGLMIAIAICILMCIIFGDDFIEKIINIFVKIASK